MHCNVSTDEVKRLIVSTLALEGVQADQIPDDMPLFERGLGLDSVDSLELCVAFQNHFGLQPGQAADWMGPQETPRSLAASLGALLPSVPREA